MNIRDEFKAEKLGFNYDQMEEFYTSKWQTLRVSWAYLVYRWTSAAFFFCTFFASLALQFIEGKFFLFLTNWGILLCLLTEILAACLATIWFCNPNEIRHERQMPFILKFYWFIYNISLLTSTSTTLIYWALIYDPTEQQHPFPAMNYTKHGVNTMFMIVDFLVVAFPQRLFHVCYTIIFVLIYLAFTFVYHVAGGTDDHGNKYIYPVLDWNSPLKVLITVSGSLLFVVFLAINFLLIDKLKDAISKRITKPEILKRSLVGSEKD